MFRSFLPAALALGFAASPALSADVAYPDGFRHWQHVKSMVINPEPLAKLLAGAV